MKILAIVKGEYEHDQNELIEDLKLDNQVEVINLYDEKLSYDGLVIKIDESDKVFSW